MIQRSDFFRQNVISLEEKLENFCILLSDNAETCTTTIANLPTNEDGIKALATKKDHCYRNHKSINIWNESNVCCVLDERWSFYLVYWYTGYITEVNEENYVVDHVHQNPLKQIRHGHYPRKSDKQIVTWSNGWHWSERRLETGRKEPKIHT